MDPVAADILRILIDDQLADHMAKQPAMGAAAAVHPDFCTLWPEAKPILQLLAHLARFIPGVGATAGAVLTALLGVADEVYDSSCKVPSAP
jgi:hypothetical protein